MNLNLTTDYVVIYAKSPIEPLKPVLDDLSIFNGSVHINWRGTLLHFTKAHLIIINV